MSPYANRIISVNSTPGSYHLHSHLKMYFIMVITSHIPGPDVNVFESNIHSPGFVACACDGDVHSRGADSWTQTDAGHRS